MENIDTAKIVLEDLLAGMGIQADVKREVPGAITDQEEEKEHVVLNITGDDAGVLIGRRGQTLDALQFLVRLIASRRTNSQVPVIVDVESYKQRHYEDLRALALNVAEQVKARKLPIKLEPMPAFERRIIHLTLANDESVATESTGEGDMRKVVVLPRIKNK